VLFRSCYAGLGESFAPGGYSYLLVRSGEATLAICIFEAFRRGSEHLERTFQSFRRRLSFEARDVRRFGGVGNVFFQRPAWVEGGVRVGEAAGTQDALWGFGNRFAVLSGALAGRFAGSDPEGHERAWRERIGGVLRAGHVNRFLFDRSGDAAYRWLLWRLGRAREPWEVLHRIYAPSAWKRALFPLICRLSGRAK
jgi:flavin-dependent dehydrogenase